MRGLGLLYPGDGESHWLAATERWAKSERAPIPIQVTSSSTKPERVWESGDSSRHGFTLTCRRNARLETAEERELDRLLKCNQSSPARVRYLPRLCAALQSDCMEGQLRPPFDSNSESHFAAVSGALSELRLSGIRSIPPSSLHF
eukprot:scaffold28840_cov49-Prasinocladus_malaysianus.AAC.6